MDDLDGDLALKNVDRLAEKYHKKDQERQEPPTITITSPAPNRVVYGRFRVESVAGGRSIPTGRKPCLLANRKGVWFLPEASLTLADRKDSWRWGDVLLPEEGQWELHVCLAGETANRLLMEKQDAGNRRLGEFPAWCESLRSVHVVKRKGEFSLEEAEYVPSGWMGDAIDGAIARKIVSTDFHSAPTCETWTYDPTKGTQGWSAVGWQFPDGNWGSHKGKDLSGMGFDRVTFWAKSSRKGTQMLIKSGGATASGVAFPASYQVTRSIVLDTEWRMYSLDISSEDLSNTVCALTLVFTRAGCPEETTVYIDDPVFRSSEE